MMHFSPQLMLRPRLAPLALALFFCAGLAHAQYVWIAPNGTRQYSDQPPPAGTPASKILKAPGRAAVVVDTAPATAAAPQAATEPAAKKPPTLAEREADYRKRSKEREQAEQKQQAEAKAAAARAERCAQAANSKRLYESGIRVADVDANGEKRVLSDAERAEQAARANKALGDCR